MRMYDVIQKKRNGEVLTEEEIQWMIRGFVDGEIPDYQMSAFLMAVYFRGMTDEEMYHLTMEMARSGDMIDLSAIKGIKVDKHSTGGVGDKTTLIIAPIVAACGVKMAKMSGRGLGHTGGTIDKLEAIPGFCTSLTRERFFEVVNETGLSVIGQTGNITPADKKLYALRDVTATVESIPLIASSIMSKKLAAGSDCIVLDVKTGSGAFMKTKEDSVLLAQKMVAIGNQSGRKTMALITNMDIPLGHAIGNALEVKEAVEVLRGHGPKDLVEVCLQLAENLLYLAGKGSKEVCLQLAKNAIANGKALACFKAMVRAQGGDASCIENPEKLPMAPIVEPVYAKESGFITRMDTQKIGVASCMLGAGREVLGESIDPAAGIVLECKTGDWVEQGDVLAYLHTSEKEKLVDSEQTFFEALTFAKQPVEKEPLVYEEIF